MERYYWRCSAKTMCARATDPPLLQSHPVWACTSALTLSLLAHTGSRRPLSSLPASQRVVPTRRATSWPLFQMNWCRNTHHARRILLSFCQRRALLRRYYYRDLYRARGCVCSKIFCWCQQSRSFADSACWSTPRFALWPASLMGPTRY